MGLGLNGGGFASTKFLAEQGAFVTVTDMKTEAELASTIEKLAAFNNIRYVLGRHEDSDFTSADLVIKNPAVRPDSKYVTMAKHIESDISLFLRFTESPIIAITGSKGKSTTASAAYFALTHAGIKAFLGGNITVSPLTFLHETSKDTPVVLELSSFQLGDLKGLGLLKPRVAIMTTIMPDHLDRYGTMECYLEDKKLIYTDQDQKDLFISDFDSPWGKVFSSESKARQAFYSTKKLPEGLSGGYIENGQGYLVKDGKATLVVPEKLKTPGEHQKKNLLTVAIALSDLGVESEKLTSAFSAFPGVEHRLEYFAEKDGVAFYNDSAATIPDALKACAKSFASPLILISGGNDKGLDFSLLKGSLKTAKKVILLSGTGTQKIQTILEEDKVPYAGPFTSLEEACKTAIAEAKKGDSVVLSPGCTSFGMFINEFDRGRKYKACISSLLEQKK